MIINEKKVSGMTFAYIRLELELDSLTRMPLQREKQNQDKNSAFSSSTFVILQRFLFPSSKKGEQLHSH